MSIYSAVTEMFRMMKETARAGEICVVILKIGCFYYAVERPHERTPYELNLIRDPSKFIRGYAGQKVNIFVLAFDPVYATKPPTQFKNAEHYIWVEDGGFYTCVIPTDVTEADVQQILADYHQLKPTLPLSSMVLMQFTGGFSEIKVDNPEFFNNLPSDCFTNVNDAGYFVVFNIKDGVMLPFKIEDSPEGLAFVNDPESGVTHFEALSAMLRQLMFTKRTKFVNLNTIRVAIDGSAHVNGRQLATVRFSKQNIRTDPEVMGNLYKMIGDVSVTNRQFFEQIVSYWLATTKDETSTLVDVLRQLYADAIADIAKVSCVTELCAGNTDTIKGCLHIVEQIKKAFVFQTTQGADCHM